MFIGSICQESRKTEQLRSINISSFSIIIQAIVQILYKNSLVQGRKFIFSKYVNQTGIELSLMISSNQNILGQQFKIKLCILVLIPV